MTNLPKSTPNPALRSTIIAVAVLGVLLSVQMMAGYLVFVAIFLLFWVPYSLAVIVKSRERRKIQAVKIGIWLSMFAVVLGIHLVRYVNVRNYADSVVKKIKIFQKQHGFYPANLEEVGISQEDNKDKLGLARYSNKPMFSYPDTMLIFHMWSYDFEKHEWVNEGD